MNRTKNIDFKLEAAATDPLAKHQFDGWSSGVRVANDGPGSLNVSWDGSTVFTILPGEIHTFDAMRRDEIWIQNTVPGTAANVRIVAW